MTDKLLPCPFCGGNDIQIDEMETFWDKNETTWRVLCINCIAETAGDTKEQAIAAWNRRAEPENNPLTLDELRQVVRCRDCKYYGEYRTNKNKQIMRYCMRMAKNDMEYHVKPDDFCSYGEYKKVEVQK